MQDDATIERSYSQEKVQCIECNSQGNRLEQ